MSHPILRQLLYRAASFVLTLAVASVLVFVIMDILPGDPAAIMLGTAARPDTLEALRHQLGLDLPGIVRYFRWVGGFFTGDLGTSITYHVPVAGLIAERLVVTVPLALLAILLSTVAGLSLGVVAAANQDRFADRAVTAASQFGVAIPDFWFGLLLILLFSTTLQWFGAGGFPGWSAGVGPALQALVLPAIALALPQASVLARVTRSAMLEVLREDFVRTARAKGLPWRVVLRRHVVPNGLVPVVTIIGLQFSFLIAGAVLVENVFGLAGLGRLAVQALAQRDLVVIRSVAMFLGALVIIVNFVVDLVYILIDPRLRSA
jgi:peptide/nickel transport system permease protein